MTTTGFDFGVVAHSGKGPEEIPEPPKVGSTTSVPQLAAPLDFEAYGRQVSIFYSGEEHQRFLAAVESINRRDGTKNSSEAVLLAVESFALEEIEF